MKRKFRVSCNLRLCAKTRIFVIPTNENINSSDLSQSCLYKEPYLVPNTCALNPTCIFTCAYARMRNRNNNAEQYDRLSADSHAAPLVSPCIVQDTKGLRTDLPISELSVSQGVINGAFTLYAAGVALLKPIRRKIFNEQNENSKIDGVAALLDFCCQLFLGERICDR